MNEVHFNVTLKNSSPINYNSPLTCTHAHTETKQNLFFVEIFIFLCIQQPVCWHISLAPESLFKFSWYVLDILKQAAFCSTAVTRGYDRAADGNLQIAQQTASTSAIFL